MKTSWCQVIIFIALAIFFSTVWLIIEIKSFRSDNKKNYDNDEKNYKDSE